MKSVSLKKKLVTYLTLAFLATSCVVIAGYFINRHLALRQSLSVEGQRLAVSLDAQVEQLLPGLLLAEEAESLAMKVDRIRDAEGLTEAKILSADEFSQIDRSKCSALKTRSGSAWLCVNPFQSEVMSLASIGLPNEILGYLMKRTQGAALQGQPGISNVLVLLAGIAAAFLGLIVFILYFIETQVRRPLLNLHQNLAPVLEGQNSPLLGVFKVSEVESVAKQVKDLVARYEDRKVKAAIGELAAQVAHDIRSPLSVLALVTRTGSELPDAQRRLLESATSRIQTIAEDLLRRYKGESSSKLSHAHPGSSALALTLIERILSEKRALYIDRDINFDLEVQADAAFAFLNLEPIALSRILSNLIDNAVEAMETSTPKIWLELRGGKRKTNFIEIIVEDNGRGIPADVLPKLGTKGASFNKDQGTGLGLHYAKSTLEEAGGDLSIESTVGAGTRVALRIPTKTAPDWFAQEIPAQRGQKIVVIDDDPTIHEFLKTKLSGFEVEHCIDDYISTLHKLASDSRCLFLFDNKLSAQGPTGLDLIQKFYLGQRSLLMTSDFESPEIQRRVLNLGCRMLPKPLLPYVPIRSHLQDRSSEVKETAFDLALIDDDDLIRSTWLLQASERGLKILVAKDLEAFLKASPTKTTLVFIDYHLGNGEIGVNVAHHLAQRGFTNLNLASGSMTEEIPELPAFILSVRGKDFPSDLFSQESAESHLRK